MTQLLSWGRSQKSGKDVTFGNRNISNKIQNVARAFNHRTCKLFLKDFYHLLCQLFTRVTELNGRKMTKMLPIYPYQNISLQNALMPAQDKKKFPKGIPYDYSCPSVDQDMIK